MRVKGIGVNLHANETVGNLEHLRFKLEKIEQLGFDCAELPIQGMRVIRNGEIDDKRLQAYLDVLRAYRLTYTTHAPFEMNLFRSTGAEIDRKIFTASLEISGAVGAQTMVVHPGRFVGEEQFLYTRDWQPYSNAEKDQWMAEERDFLRHAAERAARLHVRIGMENMRPYLDCPDYCYSVIPAALAVQVGMIDHPNIGITLDVGHAYLASKTYRLDLRAEIEAVRPHIVHLHVHDNYGRPCYASEKDQNELIALGRGDMHMPIGDGEVPMSDISGWLGGLVDGYFVHEIREMYEPRWHTLADTARGRIEWSGSRNQS